MDTQTTRTLSLLTALFISWAPAPLLAQESEEDLEDLEDLEALDAMMEEEEGMDALAQEEEDTEGDPEEERLEDLSSLSTVQVFYEAEDIAKSSIGTSTVDEEQLQAMEQENVEAHLLIVPGVYMRGEDGFGLRPNIGIRGANSERSKKVTLMEDEILFGPAPYSAPAAYYFPVMPRMTGLEVYKGPGSVAFGPNTIGGAINLRSREVPNSTRGGLKVAIGSFPSGTLHAWQGVSGERTGLLIEGVHLQSAGFKELDGGGPTGFRRSEVMLKSFATSDPSREIFHKVTLKGIASTERSHETYLGLSDADFEANPYRRYASSALDEMSWWRLALSASHRMEAGDNFDLTTTLYRHDFTRRWKKFNSFGDGTSAEFALQDPSSGRRKLFYDVLVGEQDSSTDDDEIIVGTNARQFVSQGAQWKARLRHQAESWSNAAEFGVRLHHDSIARNHTEERYRMQDGALERTQEDERTATLNEDRSLALAVHLLDQLNIARFTLTPGMRFERIRTERDDLLTGQSFERPQQVFIPGLGAGMRVWKSLSFLAGVHRGFSPVAPGQPESVTPETSISYEGGLRWLDARDSLLEVVGFYNDYRNLVGDCSFSAGCVEQDLDDQFNAGRARIFGAEAAAHHDIPLSTTRHIALRGAYTYTQASFLTDFRSSNPQLADVQAGDQLPYIPAHQASAGAGLVDEHFELRASASFVGEMREQASQGEDGARTDPQVMLDALAAYKISPKKRLYFKGENLLGSAPIISRRPYGARTLKPRFFQLGFEYNWGE